MNKGVLLVNLGSPESTNPKDVKRYLGQFLMDKRVIDVPLWARTLLVKGIILNTRPKKSAEAYSKIWWEEGSPLIVLTERLRAKVATHTKLPVEIAMRYGNPSIESGLRKLHEQGIDEVLLVPLYPQYAMATTETILVLAEELRAKHFPKMRITDVKPFYNNPDYIKVLGDSIAESIADVDHEHLLFSYHGVPERHIRKSDVTKLHCKIDGSCCAAQSKAHEFCYRHQCYETTRQVGEYLKLKPGTFSTSFQSRLGFDPWLQPYTDRNIERLGKEGFKKMAICTPAFVSDCLETLEEIAMEGEELFHEAGGKKFHTIPCINDRDDWAQLLAKWANDWAIVESGKAIA